METCKDLAGERCHAPGREQDRNKPLHENACAPNKKPSTKQQREQFLHTLYRIELYMPEHSLVKT